jgi:RNA polymerase sigma-70 factor (ECF subfamily)
MIKDEKKLVKHEDSPETWLEKYGDYLYRFALLRVNSRPVAEDLVQETLIAAIKGWEDFEGRSSVKTWLSGILKNKIFDYFRKESRRDVRSLTILESNDIVESHFTLLGLWNRFIPDWASHPEEHLRNREFYTILKSCISSLNEKSRKVFVLKVLDDLSSEEIREVLGLTDTNFWVLLHRAKMALRDCIETRWVNSNE